MSKKSKNGTDVLLSIIEKIANIKLKFKIGQPKESLVPFPEKKKPEIKGYPTTEEMLKDPTYKPD